MALSLFSSAPEPQPKFGRSGGPRTAQRAGEFGMGLFLVSLSSLFLAALVAYVLRRTEADLKGGIELPAALWASTAVILATSFLLSRARRAVELERQKRLCWSLVAAGGCTLLFLAIQAPSLDLILERHWRTAAAQDVHLYGFVLCLIVLHAIHLVGGLIPLAVVITHAFRGRYDHEHHPGVVYCGMYWHFLGAVWLVLFATLLLLQ